MSEKSMKTARIVSSIAATCISLACGTNYVYSAWGPQFAEKLKLSSTEQNLIGLSANLGMYLLGIPIGMFVDTKGPRPAVMFGAFLLGGGYFPLFHAYHAGSGNLTLLCMYSFFTGFGGCAAFAASVKTSALNWPQHRGAATGFPLAAFGLSAFFFSVFAQFVLPGDTGEFLKLLAFGTFGIVFVGFFFLRVIPQPHYSAVSTNSSRRDSMSNRLHRTRSEEAKHRASQRNPEEIGRSSTQAALSKGHSLNYSAVAEEGFGIPESDENSSLMSKSTSSSPGDEPEENSVKDHAHRVDIRGLKMLPLIEFWQLFVLMGVLTGIGLMTINNIGNNVTALWRHYDDSASEDFIMKHQAMHVSILSVCSFLGRLLSGLGSDFLVKVLRASRLWCTTIAALVFLVAQLLALSIENPHLLGLVSGLTGLGYGFLFGCFPSIVAESFGINGLSQNWGCMTLSPIISGNIFNLFYGLVYDHHSVLKPGGERECTEGLACYRSAYAVTVVACVVGLSVSLWSIYYIHQLREKEERLLREEEQRDD